VDGFVESMQANDPPVPTIVSVGTGS
jgi:hypothetical protein